MATSLDDEAGALTKLHTEKVNMLTEKVIMRAENENI